MRRFRGIHPPAGVFHAHLQDLGRDLGLDAVRQDALVSLPAILDGVLHQAEEERLGKFQRGVQLIWVSLSTPQHLKAVHLVQFGLRAMSGNDHGEFA